MAQIGPQTALRYRVGFSCKHACCHALNQNLSLVMTECLLMKGRHFRHAWMAGGVLNVDLHGELLNVDLHGGVCPPVF